MKKCSCTILLACILSVCTGEVNAKSLNEYDGLMKRVPRGFDAPRSLLGRLSLGCEKRGVSFIITDDQPLSLPSGHLLWLAMGNQVTKFTDFAQLKDRVRVRNTVQALKLVRLKTSFTRYLRPEDSRLEVEVLNIRQAWRMPNFGIADQNPFKHDRKNDFLSGYLGVLSDKAYSKGHFTPARVRAVKNHFQITRWIYKGAEHGRGDVLFVQEVLGRNGSYSRKILRQTKEPVLPRTVLSA